MADNYNQITKAIDNQTKAICKQLHQEFGHLRETLKPPTKADATIKAGSILGIFEDYLDDKEIYIPNPEKAQVYDPENIYGTEFYSLRDQIVKVLEEEE